jgi:hypothetical protein
MGPGATTAWNGLATPGEDFTATITSSGNIQLGDGVVVHPYARTGAWTEFERKSSNRYDVRHFNYMVPGDVPAIELYVVAAKGPDPPDGIFEEGMVRGYVNGFAAKAGFSHAEPVFDERLIGTTRARHTLVRLEKERLTLWIHAYIFARSPSVTFIAIRANSGGEQGIETYLAHLQWN